MISEDIKFGHQPLLLVISDGRLALAHILHVWRPKPAQCSLTWFQAAGSRWALLPGAPALLFNPGKSHASQAARACAMPWDSPAPISRQFLPILCVLAFSRVDANIKISATVWSRHFTFTNREVVKKNGIFTVRGGGLYRCFQFPHMLLKTTPLQWTSDFHLSF